MRPGWLLAVLSCLWMAGCRSALDQSPIRLVEQPAALEQQLMEAAPPGTPVEEARRMMERNNFICRYQEFEGVTYLHCVHRRTKQLNPGLEGVWTDYVYHQDGLVRDHRTRYEVVPVEHGMSTRNPLSGDRLRDGNGKRHARRHRHRHDTPSEMPVMQPEAPGEVPIDWHVVDSEQAG